MFDLLVPKIPVTHAEPGDPPPWTPSEIEKKRKIAKSAQKRALILLVIGAIILCPLMCGGSVWAYQGWMGNIMNQRAPGAAAKPTRAPAKHQATPTPTRYTTNNGRIVIGVEEAGWVTFTPAPAPVSPLPTGTP